MSKTLDGLSNGADEDLAVYGASLIYKNIYIPSLARDIVLFGKEHGEEIIHRYGLDVTDLAVIMEMPVFKAEVKNLRAMIDSGVMITTQMRAAAALEGAVDVLAGMLVDPGTKPNEAVAITKQLKELATMTHCNVFRGAGAKGDEITSAAGMTINFSFGDPNALPPIQPVIDVTPERKELIDKVGVVAHDLFSEGE